MQGRLGIFEVGSKLSNRGGMSNVHQAEIRYDQLYPERNGRQVALKIAKVKGRNVKNFEALLKREIRLLQRLRHPGVVRLVPINVTIGQYDARAREIDDANPPFYFAMELLDTTLLEDVIKSQRFTLGWRIEMAYQIAQIVEYLHLYNEPHRDLKLDNILFRSEPKPNEIPQPVLIDFGLSGKRNLKIEAMSVPYAAPERVFRVYKGNTNIYDTDQDKPPSKAEKLDRDKAADVWALGVIFYEILNQRYIFNVKRTTDIVNALTSRRPDPMNREIHDNDPKLEAFIIDRMLHSNWRKRAMMQDVMEYLAIEINHIAPRF